MTIFIGRSPAGRIHPRVDNLNASAYFDAVCTATSPGRFGGWLALSRGVVPSQSRKYCLLNDGGELPWQ